VGEGKTTEEIQDFTLFQLRGVSMPCRSAKFVTVAAVVSPESKMEFFTGIVHGKILLTPRTECRPNMPYSGIFLPDGHGKVWAQMSVEEENAVSHRGKAFRKVHDYLSWILSNNLYVRASYG